MGTNRLLMTALGTGALLVVGLLGPLTARAADPDNVTITLEGCRGGDIALPNAAGEFICPDPKNDYTTGNLGKSWDELDLVPYRITLDAGNAAPDTQSYDVAVALDYMENGKPGYDVISELKLNADLSTASCPANVSGQTLAIPGLGGIDKAIFRILSVSNQAKNTTCVYDFYGRLALGSHLFPGASLHANVALPLPDDQLTTSGIGARDVSIPVNEISPQEISKTMTAHQGASQTWNISKSTEDTLDFGNVCAKDAPTSLPVEITVTWTKAEIVGGKVAVNIVLNATNPAARTITVDLTDKLYKGANNSGTLLGTYYYGPFDLAAGHTGEVATFTVEFDAATAGSVGDWLHNEVSGKYTDKVTGVEVPGTTIATADAQIQQGAVTNASTTVQDVEDIDGTGLMYDVGTPASGSFVGYEAGTKTDDEVFWQTTGQTASGSITFSKNVYLDDPKRVTTGELSDTASLFASDGFTAETDELKIPIASSVKADLTIEKTIPNFLDTGEKLEVTFHITRASDATFSKTEIITFTGGGATTLSVTESGLVPDLYYVEEQDNTFFAAGSSTGVPINLVDTRDPETYPNPRPVDLRVVEGIATHCAGSADFENLPPTTEYPKAQVQKTTEPELLSDDSDYNWTFKLYGPGPSLLSTQTVGAGAGYSKFQSGGVDLMLMAEGTYTVVETTKSGWDLVSADPDSVTKDKVCDFAVDLPEDAGKTFSCSFLNRERGKAQVVKTVNASSDLGSYTFTFQLRKGASATASGTTLESLVANASNGGTLNFATKLVPGDTYQMCEIVGPGWLTTLGTFVPSSFIPPDGVANNPNVDNSILCVDFTVEPGQTYVFTVDNTPPPGGRALTIGYWRNWASCANSNGKQKPVLDQTLALFPGGGVYIGTLFVDTCQEAVRILSKQDVVTGKVKSSDPAYNLAAQLLAAKLNVQAGAGQCPSATTAINQGQDILNGPPPSYAVNFTGTGDYTKKGAFLTGANNLATTLDRYNNNYLCSAP